MNSVTTGSRYAFYVAGGALPPDASPYVEQTADNDLLSSLLAAEYSYLLKSRQMGKSSLSVRTRSPAIARPSRLTDRSWPS